ncbi:class I SAM-dependent methyltransferase [Glycomyces algeriensis]|uniref:Methyltransferase n=1 Tax=Glycomyces algeriensis TaxID=256037 RepID=A0A9W6GE25_9ACTN|nr:class I SAM-dependent methyltransferase [Glycomyces algeriensis]MDA1368557.1 class I SAM-dependent methyltransferase [Glycomyces algeriensis]MDR7352356.1 SAM-dependent methyltransferase [Glycomyces algeriensis]GLI45092.1 methyltransferase [Glycomyces algeriensis]
MSTWELETEIESYYERGGERERLTRNARGRLEFARMQDLLRRKLPGAGLDVLDVGGATGVHAKWLAEDGHRVTLIDPVASQVEVAAQLPGVTAVVGDARELPWDDASFDAVLLMGPLYHLTDREHRVQAVAEAARCARPGGIVAAVTINRTAGWNDFLLFRSGGVDKGLTAEASLRIMREGMLRYYDQDIFTTAYLAHPGEVASEFADAGLDGAAQYAVQGFPGYIPELERLIDDPESREHLMDGLRLIEAEPSLLGASNHLLTVATTPA